MQESDEAATVVFHASDTPETFMPPTEGRLGAKLEVTVNLTIGVPRVSGSLGAV